MTILTTNSQQEHLDFDDLEFLFTDNHSEMMFFIRLIYYEVCCIKDYLLGGTIDES